MWLVLNLLLLTKCWLISWWSRNVSSLDLKVFSALSPELIWSNYFSSDSELVGRVFNCNFQLPCCLQRQYLLEWQESHLFAVHWRFSETCNEIFLINCVGQCWSPSQNWMLPLGQKESGSVKVLQTELIEIHATEDGLNYLLVYKPSSVEHSLCW